MWWLTIALTLAAPEPSGLVGAVGGPAPRGGADAPLVVWTAERAFAVQHASGRAPDFAPVLDGDGPIAAVALDADGATYVVRAGDRLGVRDAGGGERWRRIPDATSTTALAVSGGRIVWLGEADGATLYQVSLDRGATFTARPEWPTGNFDNRFVVDRAGRVHVILGSEAGCGGGGQSRYSGALADATLHEESWGLDAPIDYVPTAGRWAYVVSPGCGDDADDVAQLCAVGLGDGELRRIVVARGGLEDWSMLGAVDGARAWLVVGTTLVSASGGRGRVLSRSVPAGDARVLAVAGGTPWLVADGKLFVFAAGGWTHVPRPTQQAR